MILKVYITLLAVQKNYYKFYVIIVVILMSSVRMYSMFYKNIKNC